MPMRSLWLAALIALTSACSGSSGDAPTSKNVQRWKAGSAVVVLSAKVDGAFSPDVESLGHRPGVIAASVAAGRLKIAFSRQAALVDLAALRSELQSMGGLSDVTETFTRPVPQT